MPHPKMKHWLSICLTLAACAALHTPQANAQVYIVGDLDTQVIQNGSNSSQINFNNLFYDPNVPFADSVFEFQTNNNESIFVHMFDTATPITVTNFGNYANNGLFDDTIIHRAVNDFIVQGGGFKMTDTAEGIQVNKQPSTYGNILNEYSPTRSNLRGTIAMAKLGGDPDSATNQWFFNLGDNSGNLDNQNGGFTVFGNVMGEGMGLVDAMAAGFERQLFTAFGIQIDPNGPYHIPINVDQFGQTVYFDKNQDGTIDENDLTDFASFTGVEDVDGDSNFDTWSALGSVPIRNESLEPIAIEVLPDGYPTPYLPFVNTIGLDNEDLFAFDSIREIQNITYDVIANTTRNLISDITFDENGVATIDYIQGASGEGTLTVRATNALGDFLDTSFDITVLGETGDVDFNNTIDATDVLNLSMAINENNQAAQFDIDFSGVVDSADGISLVQDILGHPLGDFNLDGQVDVSDLSTWASGFATAEYFRYGDSNFDGQVDVADLSTWASTFGHLATGPAPLNSSNAAIAIPEPATALLLLTAPALLLRRRQRAH